MMDFPTRTTDWLAFIMIMIAWFVSIFIYTVFRDVDNVSERSTGFIQFFGRTTLNWIGIPIVAWCVYCGTFYHGSDDWPWPFYILDNITDNWIFS